MTFQKSFVGVDRRPKYYPDILQVNLRLNIRLDVPAFFP